MNEIAVLRADHYTDGTIVPILITYSNGKTEIISSVKKIVREGNGKRHIIYCTTAANRDLILHFHNAKWDIVNVGS